MHRKWLDEEDARMPVKRQGTETESSTTTTESSTTTTSTTSTTSTTPTSTTTSTSATSTSASTTSTSTTSSTPTSTSTPVSTPSSSSRSSLTLSTRPDGGIVTITQTLSAPSQSHTSDGGNKGFFDNKAQVGAVFGVAGLVGLVLAFFLITTCIRRRRAKQFDKDVAEAAAAAAASNANPFLEDEDERGNQGASWDPRRTSTLYSGQGYGRINDDPYGYAAAGVVGGGAAGFGRSNTNRYQGGNQRNAYNMNDMSSSGHPPSSYSGYSGGAGYYMNDLPPIPGAQDYGRPSFSSTTAPGVAGVGSGGGYGAPEQNVRYRGQQQSSAGNPEDAYGGYAVTTPEADPYTNNNRYSSGASYSQPMSTNYNSSTSNRLSASSPPTTIPPSRSPPPISPTAPPSYSGHSGGHEPPVPEPRQQLRPPSFQRPLSGPPPNMPLPPTPGTPDEQAWDPTGRPLRVANE